MDLQSTLSLTGERGRIEPFAALFDARFGDEGLPASLFETDPEAGDGSPWRFTLTVPTQAGDEWLDRLVLLARERWGERGAEAGFEREDHGEVDWVAMTLAELAPVRAGRFLVHGSHDRSGRAGGRRRRGDRCRPRLRHRPSRHHGGLPRHAGTGGAARQAAAGAGHRHRLGRPRHRRGESLPRAGARLRHRPHGGSGRARQRGGQRRGALRRMRGRGRASTTRPSRRSASPTSCWPTSWPGR